MSRALSLAGVAGLVMTFGVPATAAGTDPGLSLQWGLERIGADHVWEAADGSGITIAIVDSGVNLQHPDLVDRLLPGFDFVDRDTDADDEAGHGTHVAGIAAATRGNGRGGTGVAPGARILPVRVLDADGSGRLADVAAGVRWAVDRGAWVVNLSLGSTTGSLLGTQLDEAVRYAWERGAVAVVAAGNDYVLGSGFSDEPAIVVAATTRDDRAPGYSNGVGSARWGVSAPGGGVESPVSSYAEELDIFSTYWLDDGADDTYAYMAGTSMAAPHVSGAVAVLLSAGLTPDQAVTALLDTAVDLGRSGRDSTFGVGRIDLAAAMAAAGRIPDPAPSPATSAPEGTRTTTPPATTPPPTAGPVPSTPATPVPGGPELRLDEPPRTPTVAGGPLVEARRSLDDVASPRPVAPNGASEGASRTGPALVATAALMAAASAAVWSRRRAG